VAAPPRRSARILRDFSKWNQICRLEIQAIPSFNLAALNDFNELRPNLRKKRRFQIFSGPPGQKGAWSARGRALWVVESQASMNSENQEANSTDATPSLTRSAWTSTTPRKCRPIGLSGQRASAD
jgi:hypothetical protein